MLPAGGQVSVANITYRGEEEGEYSGTVVVAMNGTEYVEVAVPYTARVAHGTLHSTPASLEFVGVGGLQSIELSLSNSHAEDVALGSATVSMPVGSLPKDVNFSLVGFPAGAVLGAGATTAAGTLSFKPGEKPMTKLASRGQLAVKHNASDKPLIIPLSVFSGRLAYSVSPTCNATNLKRERPKKSSEETPRKERAFAVDFGAHSVGEERSCAVTLHNRNPLPVPITAYASDVPTIKARLEEVLAADGILARSGGTSEVGAPLGSGGGAVPLLLLEAGGSATVRLELSATHAHSRAGVLSFSTPHESLVLPVRYETLDGALSFSPSTLRFAPTFPGHVLTKPIVAKSTFAMRVSVRALDGSGPMWHPLLVNYSTDKEVIYEATDSVHLAGAKGKDRVKVVLSKDVVKKDGETLGEYAKRKGYGVTAINANEKVQIGYLQLDAKAGLDKEDDYMVDHCVKHCPRWTPGASLNDFELKTLSLRRARWAALQSRGATELSATVSVATDVVGATLAAQGSLTWPKLASTAEVAFGLHHVGTAAAAYVPVRNRADVPVWVQLWGSQSPEYLGLDEADDVSRHFRRTAPRGGDLLKRRALPSAFHIPEEGARPRLLKPGEEAQLGPVHFTPPAGVEGDHVRAWLYVRNNLTLLDEVILHGEGGAGRFAFEEDTGDPATSVFDGTKIVYARTGTQEPPADANKKRPKAKALGELSFEIKDHALQCGQKKGGKLRGLMNGRFATRFAHNFTIANRGTMPLQIYSLSLGEPPLSTPLWASWAWLRGTEGVDDHREPSCAADGFVLHDAFCNLKTKPTVYELAPGGVTIVQQPYESGSKQMCVVRKFQPCGEFCGCGWPCAVRRSTTSWP